MKAPVNPPANRDPPISPIRYDEWLEHLPLVFNPKEERHERGAHDRRELRNMRLTSLCRSELEGIFCYAMNVHRHSNDKAFSECGNDNRLRWRFRVGGLAAEPPEPDKPRHRVNYETLLRPLHSLEVQHYLQFQSDSVLSDLSSMFGVSMTETWISDCNPIFDKLLRNLQDGMQPYLREYKPFDRMEFPFLIVVVGPTASGKTTVCQFLQKVFDLHIIECRCVPCDSRGSPKGTRPILETTIESPDDMVEEFPLTDSVSIRYTNDKDCIAKLIAAIKARQPDGKGFVITGYPHDRKQLAVLEKALCSAQAHTHELLLKFQQLLSARARAQLPAINGVIFTLYTDPNPERLVDPETGSVYKKAFYMPGLADLIGVKPRQFTDAKRVIEERLYAYVAGDYPMLSAKGHQQWLQFEQQMKKLIPTVSIGTCDSAMQILQHLDSFLVDLYKKNPQYITVPSPMVTLLRAQALSRPGKCYGAIRTWYTCLEVFGRAMADQSRLVSTLASKVDGLIRAASDRYQLLISHRDPRPQACRDFMLLTKKDLSAHFKQIWELSIGIRNANLELIDEVIDNAGLIELLLELRKSAKIVFVAFIHRFIQVRWFSNKFSHLMAEGRESNGSLDKFETSVSPDIPSVNYLISTNEVSEEPRGNMDDPLSFEFLMQSLRVRTEKVTGVVSFDVNRACDDLGISPFEGPEFADIGHFADAFFGHLESSITDKLLIQEARSSRTIFTRFASLCRQKELSMVAAVFGLRDSLRKFAYSKCAHEMETFSGKFRRLKNGEKLTGDIFEFDILSVNQRVRHLARALVLAKSPVVIQSLVSFDSIVILAHACQNLRVKYSSDVEFLEIAATLALDRMEIESIELCLRVMECVECFEVQKFLSCFAKTRDEEALLSRVFSQKRIGGTATRSILGSMSDLASTEELDLRSTTTSGEMDSKGWDR
jgi:adenylate kinase family enzyme